MQEETNNDMLNTDFFATYGDLLMQPIVNEYTPTQSKREQPPYRGPPTRVLSNPRQNYSQLRNTLRILEEYDIFTEEWKDDQKVIVGDYSELVHFIKSSDKMRTERYRKLVEQMEDALDQVIDCILKYDDIEINFYTDFVKAMIKVYECELDVDILCEQMSNL